MNSEVPRREIMYKGMTVEINKIKFRLAARTYALGSLMLFQLTYIPETTEFFYWLDRSRVLGLMRGLR